MDVVYGFESLGDVASSVVSVGSFDGVHLGHRAIMARMNHWREVVARGDESFSRYGGGGCGKSACLEGAQKSAACVQTKSIVVTFEPHPRHFISGRCDEFKLLSTIEEKAMLLESCGVDIMVVAKFDKDFMSTTTAEFLKILHDKLSMKVLMAGFNHRLGCDGVGGIESLSALASKYDVRVEVMPEFFVDGHKVSSTLVRGSVEAGDIALTRQLMGRSYFALVDSCEIKKSQFSVSHYKLLPQCGQYKCRVTAADGQVLVGEVDAMVDAQGQVRLLSDLCASLEGAGDKLVVEFL